MTASVTGRGQVTIPAEVRRVLGTFADRPWLGFEDALMVAHMQDEGIGEIYSYERGFDRVSIVTLKP